MKKRPPPVARVTLAAAVQRLAGEIERLLPEVRAALGAGERTPLAQAARSLERAAAAVRALVDRAGPGAGPGTWPPGIQELLEGAAPAIALFGSRVVLAGKAGGPPRPPSAAARALAVLLEYSDRSMDAGDIAARLGCSVPAARTTLNRLVKSGHAMRTAPGWFRARSG